MGKSEKKYSGKKMKSPVYKTVYAINEWCDISRKWHKLRKPIGKPSDPISDEDLTEFIIENVCVELNLGIFGPKGEKHDVDFPVEDLLVK